jgi:hypothetical protein
MRYAFLVLCLISSGCATLKPLFGGKATSKIAGVEAGLTAPDNAKTPSSQIITRTTVTEYPSNSKLDARFPEIPSSTHAIKDIQTTANSATVAVPSKVTVTETVSTQLGVSDKDTSREISAKLAAMRPIQFAGIALLVAALAMFHPVVRAIVGSGKEMQMTVGAAGLGLIFAPQFIAGNEGIIIVIVAVALLFIYLNSRHSYNKGILDNLPTDKAP